MGDPRTEPISKVLRARCLRQQGRVPVAVRPSLPALLKRSNSHATKGGLRPTGFRAGKVFFRNKTPEDFISISIWSSALHHLARGKRRQSLFAGPAQPVRVAECMCNLGKSRKCIRTTSSFFLLCFQDLAAGLESGQLAWGLGLGSFGIVGFVWVGVVLLCWAPSFYLLRCTHVGFGIRSACLGFWHMPSPGATKVRVPKPDVRFSEIRALW